MHKGSIPLFPAYLGIAQLGRAPALGAGCCRFKSCYLDFARLVEMVDTAVLEAAAIRHKSSSLLSCILRLA